MFRPATHAPGSTTPWWSPLLTLGCPGQPRGGDGIDISAGSPQGHKLAACLGFSPRSRTSAQTRRTNSWLGPLKTCFFFACLGTTCRGCLPESHPKEGRLISRAKDSGGGLSRLELLACPVSVCQPSSFDQGLCSPDKLMMLCFRTPFSFLLPVSEEPKVGSRPFSPSAATTRWDRPASLLVPATVLPQLQPL